MSDRIDTPDFSPQLDPMPALRWSLREEYVTRDEKDPNKVSMVTVADEATEKSIKGAFIATFEQNQREQVAALQADNLDAFNKAFGRQAALVGEINKMQETGDNNTVEVDGAWQGGYSLFQLRKRFPVETFHVKIDLPALLERCKRVRSLVEMRDTLDALRSATHQTLGYELALLEPILRDAHRGLEAHFISSWTLRRLAADLIDYVTGAAKQAAERARQNKRLVENTRNSVISLFNSQSEGKAAPAAPPTPPSPTPPPPPSPPTHITRR